MRYFVARHGSCTSSHPKVRKAFGASDKLIHRKNCRALHRTLRPDAPMESLIELLYEEGILSVAVL